MAASLDMEFSTDPRNAIAKELWQDWRVDPSIENRNRLFSHYEEWTKKIASQLFKRYRTNLTEWFDFLQLSVSAVLSSIERFDSSRGVQFEAFAYPRVRGAVLNGVACYFKDARPGTKSKYQERLMAGLLIPSEPLDTLEEVIGAAVGLAFGQFLETGLVSQEFAPDPIDNYHDNSISEILWAIIDEFPEGQKFVMKWHYQYHMDFIQISELMDVSRARVSQLHSLSLVELRDALRHIEL